MTLANRLSRLQHRESVFVNVEAAPGTIPTISESINTAALNVVGVADESETIDSKRFNNIDPQGGSTSCGASPMNKWMTWRVFSPVKSNPEEEPDDREAIRELRNDL
eukprot:gnl/Chilomastix_caulleri/3502.p1 GENE.gnl/Chilomastix_caulleri/3502~~gnl/Chilomastix_caulleri/3502.p1  ORF type:complete len:107 (-),score=20.31 gnl/Chilomastix_caulleri/3502:57-377(-)